MWYNLEYILYSIWDIQFRYECQTTLTRCKTLLTPVAFKIQLWGLSLRKKGASFQKTWTPPNHFRIITSAHALKQGEIVSVKVDLNQLERW